MTHLLVWVVALEPDRCRLGDGDSAVSHDERLRPCVRSALVGVAGQITQSIDLSSCSSDDPVARWHLALKRVHGQAVALAVVRPRFEVSHMSVLDSSQSVVREFWLGTRFRRCPLIFMEFICVKMVAAPITVRESDSAKGAGGLFFKVVFTTQTNKQTNNKTNKQHINTCFPGNAVFYQFAGQYSGPRGPSDVYYCSRVGRAVRCWRAGVARFIELVLGGAGPSRYTVCFAALEI